MNKTPANLKLFNQAVCNAAFLGCETKDLKERMYCDPSGFYWCEEHKYRGRLLNWAEKHGYPAIEYAGTDQRYAIGNDEELWKVAVRVGSEDMVWSALIEVMGIDDEGEEAL